MAVISPTSRSVDKSYRRYAFIWLLLTLVLGVVTALVWMFSKTPSAQSQIENAPITTQAVTPADVIRPTNIESLHELDADVQPIDFDAMVRDLRDYPKEFKDKRYLIANKGKWTVQVMNVAENDVIVDYLLGREDRDKFAYFRYRDDNDQLRYMLTYGIMSSPQEAIGASQLIDFGLPANVRVIPEEINRYVSIIDNYELADPVVDLAANGNREVKLRPARREVPVRPKQPPQTSSSGAATTGLSDGNTDQNSSASRSGATSNSGNERAQTTEQPSIKASDNTQDTLAVQEERRVDTGSGEAATPAASKSKNTEAKKGDAKPASNSPEAKVSPDKAKDKKQSASEAAAPSAAKEKDKGSASKADKDPIKSLIEEKIN